MDNPGYVSLTRQSGLLREMQAIANNIANVSTTGFRREGVVFSEYVAELEGHEPSLSMASGEGRSIDQTQGALVQTGGTFDFAIEGDGFFLIATPDGNQITRGGSFTVSPEGELSTAEGFRLLDSGGAPIFVPTDAGQVAVARDGTMSAGGIPLAQVGLWVPTDPNTVAHVAGTRFAAETGVEPYENGQIFQGFLENSNVNPVIEIARMIEVQRAYELGQGFLDKEDGRVLSVIQTLGR